MRDFQNRISKEAKKIADEELLREHREERKKSGYIWDRLKGGEFVYKDRDYLQDPEMGAALFFLAPSKSTFDYRRVELKNPRCSVCRLKLERYYPDSIPPGLPPGLHCRRCGKVITKHKSYKHFREEATVALDERIRKWLREYEREDNIS